MDSKKKEPAKKQRGDLTEDQRTKNGEENPVTKIKLPEFRKDNTADFKRRKDSAGAQGRGDLI